MRGSDTGVYPHMSDLLAALEIPVLQGWDPANLDPAPDVFQLDLPADVRVIELTP